AVCGQRGVQSCEHKTSASVAVGFSVELNAAKISSPAESVFPTRPDHGIRKGPGLIPHQLRVGVLEASEISEGEIRQAPVEGILRHSINSKLFGDVLRKCVEILRGDAAAIGIYSQNVGELSEA